MYMPEDTFSQFDLSLYCTAKPHLQVYQLVQHFFPTVFFYSLYSEHVFVLQGLD